MAYFYFSLSIHKSLSSYINFNTQKKSPSFCHHTSNRLIILFLSGHHPTDCNPCATLNETESSVTRASIFPFRLLVQVEIIVQCVLFCRFHSILGLTWLVFTVFRTAVFKLFLVQYPHLCVISFSESFSFRPSNANHHSLHSSCYNRNGHRPSPQPTSISFVWPSHRRRPICI